MMNKKILRTIQIGKIKRKTSENYVCEVETDAGMCICLVPLKQSGKSKIGDFIEGFITKPVLTPTGIQYIMSRGEDYITCLCNDLIPVINSGRVKVERVVREPGIKIKIAVSLSEDEDCVKNAAAVSVGHNGEYVALLRKHLDNEYIDIVNWSADDPKANIINALAPAEVISIQCDPGTRSAKAQVPKKQIGLALGKNGSNVRLASELTDYAIKVYAANEEYLDQFEFPDWVRRELEKAGLIDSDSLIEIYQNNNKDGLISDKAFKVLLDIISVEDETVEDEDEEEIEFFCPVCGESLPDDIQDIEGDITCPHCGEVLVFED